VGQDTLVREELFEGCRWPNDHHIAAGRSAIFDPVKARRSADGGAEDVSRQVRIGGDRKGGDQAIETIAYTVNSPSLIACRAFAHVCSIIQSGERTASSFRWIRRSRYLCAVDDLAFADRSEATVADPNNRAGRQGIGRRIVARTALRMAAEVSSRSRSRGAAAGLSALIYQAREPPDMVAAGGNCMLTKRVPQGRTLWFGRSFSRVSDGRTTIMSLRT